MFEIAIPVLLALLGLLAGGEFLVRGSVRLAQMMGVSPLMIGLTLVGFGTSTPELVTSVQAALSGSPGLAYGNIVGSNIANVLLILGLTAAVTPILVTSAALRRDGAVMLVAALGFAALAATMPMGRWLGLAFLAALGFYIYLAFRQERAAAAAQAADHGAAFQKGAALEAADPAIDLRAATNGGFALALITALAGLALIVVGGSYLVDGAVALSRRLGVSETVIGLTVVAVGTSLPELATSLIAAIKRETDIAFGNIVGSNIYNVLGIGGATAVMAPGPVPAEIAGFDAPLMGAITMVLLVLAWTGLRLARWEGALLLAGYGAYVRWIWP